MASDRVKIDQMASAIMESLQDYADTAADEMKEAVRDAGKTVKKEIQANAPVETGAYKKSWTVKTVRETSQSLELVVHSKNRYQLAHLLEHGHALRSGGRARAFPHIAPAEAGRGHSRISLRRRRKGSGSWKRNWKGGWADDA